MLKIFHSRPSLFGPGNMAKSVAEKCFTVLLILFLTMGSSACEKDPEIVDTEIPGTDKDSTKVDPPFSNVPSTSDIVMYEVNLSVFSPEGTLEGVRADLDALKDVGVNVIWLMPIHPIGELKGIGSPYSVKDYFAVNEDLGTMEELKLLVKEAHEKDMAVILDWVANHTSWDNSWISNKAWYVQDASGNIVSPNGWNDVAELDYSNLLMRQEMIKAMKFWVSEVNIDGYRCDVADGVPSDFWKSAIDTLRAMPDREIIMFAEGTRKDLYAAGFNLTFGWNFYHTLKEVYNSGMAVSTLVSAHLTDYSHVPSGSHILRFTSNHDDNAWDDTPVNIFNSKEGSVVAFVLTAYMGGVPLVYCGQEVGYPLKLAFFRDNTSQIDWTINPEMRLEYKKIIEFRKSSQAVKDGTLIAFTENDDVIAFQRISGTEEVLVIANVRNSLIDFELPDSLANSTWLNMMDNTEITLGNSIEMNPYSYFILKN